MQIEGIQILFKQQKERSKEENMKRRKRTFVIFCLNVFEESSNLLYFQTPYLSHFCSILNDLKTYD
jgi:hypothetical protein